MIVVTSKFIDITDPIYFLDIKLTSHSSHTSLNYHSAFKFWQGSRREREKGEEKKTESLDESGIVNISTYFRTEVTP
jgi:hypothetical protein